DMRVLDMAFAWAQIRKEELEWMCNQWPRLERLGLVEPDGLVLTSAKGEYSLNCNAMPGPNAVDTLCTYFVTLKSVKIPAFARDNPGAIQHLLTLYHDMCILETLTGGYGPKDILKYLANELLEEP
ncbi:hypothetical protein BGX27_000511, partial [Mortierella sp. AM989]